MSLKTSLNNLERPEIRRAKDGKFMGYADEDKQQKPKECKHEFWKDRNPPQCFNCGKTEEQLLEEKYKNREIK